MTGGPGPDVTPLAEIAFKAAPAPADHVAALSFSLTLLAKFITLTGFREFPSVEHFAICVKCRVN